MDLGKPVGRWGNKCQFSNQWPYSLAVLYPSFTDAPVGRLLQLRPVGEEPQVGLRCAVAAANGMIDCVLVLEGDRAGQLHDLNTNLVEITAREPAPSQGQPNLGFLYYYAKDDLTLMWSTLRGVDNRFVCVFDKKQTQAGVLIGTPYPELLFELGMASVEAVERKQT